MSSLAPPPTHPPASPHPALLTWRLMMSPMSRNRAPGLHAAIAAISASWVTLTRDLLVSSTCGAAAAVAQSGAQISTEEPGREAGA
jgi:hypothetical protein